MKKQVLLTLLAVLTISILPGCGKSKNNEGKIIGGGGGGVIVPPPPVSGGSGGCFNTSSIVNSGLTLGFSGNVSLGTGIQAQMPLYGHNTSIPGGYTNTYYRDTALGDRIDIAVNGSSAYAQVTISANAVAWVNYYGGGQICGFYVDATIHSVMYGKAQGGYDGNFGGGTVALYTGRQGVFLRM